MTGLLPIGKEFIVSGHGLVDVLSQRAIGGLEIFAKSLRQVGHYPDRNLNRQPLNLARSF
jgi:hypothetical protein